MVFWVFLSFHWCVLIVGRSGVLEIAPGHANWFLLKIDLILIECVGGLEIATQGSVCTFCKECIATKNNEITTGSVTKWNCIDDAHGGLKEQNQCHRNGIYKGNHRIMLAPGSGGEPRCLSTFLLALFTCDRSTGHPTVTRLTVYRRPYVRTRMYFALFSFMWLSIGGASLQNAFATPSFHEHKLSVMVVRQLKKRTIDVELPCRAVAACNFMNFVLWRDATALRRLRFILTHSS